jgi:polyisoprenoid-binding protein YceI
MNATITAYDLQKLVTCGSVALIDVLLPEDFACRHIIGARNACVYEMVFLDRVTECVPDRSNAVVVYDESGTTLAARAAKEKLERAGYQNVAILEGGLKAWQAAGFDVEESAPFSPPVTVCDGTYHIDTAKSVVEWTGRNINNRHYGRIEITEGEVVIGNGRPVSGRFVLGINSMTNLDIKDDGWRSMLLTHLKSDDFFDVERYPTVTFELRGAAAIGDAPPGTPNMEIAGALTIKKTTRPLCFPAIIAAQDDGSLKAQATINLDRTLWEVCYGSGRLYERLGMHLVNDLISIELFIVAR